MPLPNEARYTMADVLAWPEDVRVELIGGAAVSLAPPSRAHQKISGELYRQIANYLEGRRCEVYAAPFAVRLFAHAGDRPEEVDTLVEPDLAVVCDPEKLDERGCRGAPDLIIEVLSPSTQRHDRLVKYRLYQHAGVREYWIVDPESRTVQVSLLQSDGRYQLAEVYTAGDVAKVNVLEGCFLELAKVFA